MAVRKDARLAYRSNVGTYGLKDLIIKRPDEKLLAIQPATIDVAVTFPKDVGETAWKKYYAPIIDNEAQRYQKIIEQEAAALAKKIKAFKKSGEIKKAEEMVAATSHSINSAIQTLGGHLPALIDGELAKQAKRDRSLLKARVKVAYKAGKIVLSLGASIAKLVGSSGADISSYFNIAKELKAAGELIYQQTKGEKKLRADMHKGYKSFLDAAKDDSSKPAETALNTYRNHSTKTKNSILSTAKNADKLQAKMKAAKDLKGGVKLGAKAMTVKREAGRLVDKYGECETYADEYEKCLEDSRRKLKEFVDKELAGKYDALVVQKSNKLEQFVAYAEAFLDEVDGIYGNISDIVGG